MPPTTASRPPSSWTGCASRPRRAPSRWSCSRAPSSPTRASSGPTNWSRCSTPTSWARPRGCSSTCPTTTTTQRWAPLVRHLAALGVTIRTDARVTDLTLAADRVTALVSGEPVEADACVLRPTHAPPAKWWRRCRTPTRRGATPSPRPATRPRSWSSVSGWTAPWTPNVLPSSAPPGTATWTTCRRSSASRRAPPAGRGPPAARWSSCTRTHARRGVRPGRRGRRGGPARGRTAPRVPRDGWDRRAPPRGPRP